MKFDKNSFKVIGYVWIVTFLSQFIIRIVLFELINIPIGFVMLIIQPILSILIGIIAFFKFNKSLIYQPKIKITHSIIYYIKRYLLTLTCLFIGTVIWIQNIGLKLLIFSDIFIAPFIDNKFLFVVMDNLVMSIILEFKTIYYLISYISYTILKCRYGDLKL